MSAKLWQETPKKEQLRKEAAGTWRSKNWGDSRHLTIRYDSEAVVRWAVTVWGDLVVDYEAVE
jgi:hypothetical protein